MTRKAKETTTPAAPAARGRGRPRGSTNKTHVEPSPPRRPTKPKLTDIERKSWSRSEFCARHGIGSLNTYTAMLKRGDGPKEMIIGTGAHATRRITLEAEAAWQAQREAAIISEEAVAADRAKRAKGDADKSGE
jgi:hypothetical protein